MPTRATVRGQDRVDIAEQMRTYHHQKMLEHHKSAKFFEEYARYQQLRKLKGKEGGRDGDADTRRYQQIRFELIELAWAAHDYRRQATRLLTALTCHFNISKNWASNLIHQWRGKTE